jgi:hypothetical protein
MFGKMLQAVQPEAIASMRMVKGGCAVQRLAKRQPPAHLSLAWRQYTAVPAGQPALHEAKAASWIVDDPRAVRTGRSAGSTVATGRCSGPRLERLVTFSLASFLVPNATGNGRSARRTSYRTTRLRRCLAG